LVSVEEEVDDEDDVEEEDESDAAGLSVFDVVLESPPLLDF